MAGCHQEVVEVTAQEQMRLLGVIQHRVESVPPAQVLQSIRVTTAARTLCDLAAVVSPPDQRRRVDDALDRRLVDLTDLVACMEELGAGRRGFARLRPIVDERLAIDTESVLERRVLTWLEPSNLPLCVTQYDLRTKEGALYRLDFAWPEHRVVVEASGYRYHGSRTAFDRDSERFSTLAAEGWKVLVVTATTQRHQFMQQLAAALRPLRRSA